MSVSAATRSRSANSSSTPTRGGREDLGVHLRCRLDRPSDRFSDRARHAARCGSDLHEQGERRLVTARPHRRRHAGFLGARRHQDGARRQAAESDLDYLLESDDYLRAGALRYFDGPGRDAKALAPPKPKGQTSIPRLLDLEQIVAEGAGLRDRSGLLPGKIAPAWSVAICFATPSARSAVRRPKVNALAPDGSLWIVKLAKIDDEYAIARAEVMAAEARPTLRDQGRAS